MSRRSGRFTQYVRENGLTLAFLLLLLLSLAGQALSGLAEFNNAQLVDGADRFSLLDYLTSSSFAVDVAENWQSEYLQFALYIAATTWLVQRGSSESKKPGEEGLGSEEEQKIGRYAAADSPAWASAGGWRTALYGRSLAAIMTFFFLMSLLAQSVAGRAAFNVELLNQRQDPLRWSGYATSADFWNRALQNWQSEFLAVASMSAFAIYLRQRGSPESKLVGAAHDSTDEDS
jgi:membrane protein implicated in regulation of membrane protease activity